MYLAFLPIILCALAQDANQAEKLFRAAEKKIAEADTAHLKSDGVLDVGKGIKLEYKVNTWTAKGNKAHIEDIAISAGQEFKSGRVSDGETWWEKPLDAKSAKRNKIPANFNATLLGLSARSGVSLGYAWIETAGFKGDDLLAQIKASGFSLGDKETVGPRGKGREAQIVNYQLTYNDQRFTGKVWLDVETNLPLKRIVSADDKSGQSWTENCEIRLNEKVDPKMFERPK
jgi:hypothetical protein